MNFQVDPSQFSSETWTWPSRSRLDQGTTISWQRAPLTEFGFSRNVTDLVQDKWVSGLNSMLIDSGDSSDDEDDEFEDDEDDSIFTDESEVESEIMSDAPSSISRKSIKIEAPLQPQPQVEDQTHTQPQSIAPDPEPSPETSHESRPEPKPEAEPVSEPKAEETSKTAPAPVEKPAPQKQEKEEEKIEEKRVDDVPPERLRTSMSDARARAQTRRLTVLSHQNLQHLLTAILKVPKTRSRTILVKKTEQPKGEAKNQRSGTLRNNKYAPLLTCQGRANCLLERAEFSSLLLPSSDRQSLRLRKKVCLVEV